MNSFCHHTATVGKKVVAPWLLLRPTYCISTKIGESLVKEVSRDFFSTSTEERKYVKAICQLFFHKHYSTGITLLCTTYATVIHHPPRAPWVVGRLEGFQFPLDRMTLLYSIKSIAALYTIFSVLGRTQKVIRVKKGRVKKVFDHHCIALVFPRRSTTKTTTRLGTRLSNTSMASAAPSSQPLPRPP